MKTHHGSRAIASATPLAAAVAAMSLTLTACTAGAAGTETAGSSDATPIHGDISFNDAALTKLDSAIKAALKGKKLDGLNLAMVVNVPQGYWLGGNAGFSRGLSELGVKGVFQTPDNGRLDEQLAIIRTLRSQQVSAFSISAIDPAALKAPLQSATAAGIPVLAIDSPLPAADGAALYLGTPNYQAGQKAGEAMRAALGGKGRVAVLVGSLTASNALERIQGFEDALKGTDIKVVQKIADQMSPTNATNDAQQILSDHPDITGLYCVYSYDGPAAASAVWESGKTGKVKVVSDDADPQTLGFIHQGVIQATVVQSPYQQGYTGAFLLAALRVLGRKATMDLVKPYLGSDGTLSSGVGVVTQENLAAFTASQNKLGISE
ncbi:substrate-binding domain-containing protein [Streptacidiphilus monticola]|uniref:Substrate-binding domain-containing protein n=1 Tax=Streptacidiphilus monticola TaxID=2161674 RepID=A0ABW1G6J4_9ACTN